MKVWRILRNTLVFSGWTGGFLFFSNLLVKLIWRFNFMSSHSWSILKNFWNNGGIIKTASDVTFIFILFLLPVLWIAGFFWAKKLDFIKILLSPFTLIGRIFGGKPKEEKRIVIKNLKSSQQQSEDYKAEIEAAGKPKKSKEAENIRQELLQKRAKNSE